MKNKEDEEFEILLKCLSSAFMNIFRYIVSYRPFIKWNPLQDDPPDKSWSCFDPFINSLRPASAAAGSVTHAAAAADHGTHKNAWHYGSDIMFQGIFGFFRVRLTFSHRRHLWALVRKNSLDRKEKHSKHPRNAFRTLFIPEILDWILCHLLPLIMAPFLRKSVSWGYIIIKVWNLWSSEF